MRYLLSLAEQGFSATLNFGVNLWLIRQVGAAEYGVFVFWNNVSLLLNSVQGAWTLCHLLALPPGADNLGVRREPERVLFEFTVFLLLFAALAGSGASVLGWFADFSVPYSLVAFLPAFLLYQYARTLAYSRGTVLQATLLTAAVLLVGAASIAVVLLLGQTMSAENALLALSIAYAVPSSVVLWRLSLPMRLFKPPFEWVRYREYLLQSRWVMLGVISTELLARAYSIAVPAWFGIAALGTLSAAQVLLRPVVLAANAWGWVARAEMAERREAQDWHNLGRTVVHGALFSLSISVPWAVLVVMAWPLISSHLYAGRYADAGSIVLLWGIWAALAGLQNAVSSGLQALRAFKALALANTIGACLTVLAIMLLFLRFDYRSSIVGMYIGQLVEIILMSAILRRHLLRGHLSLSHATHGMSQGDSGTQQ